MVGYLVSHLIVQSQTFGFFSCMCKLYLLTLCAGEFLPLMRSPMDPACTPFYCQGWCHVGDDKGWLKMIAMAPINWLPFVLRHLPRMIRAKTDFMGSLSLTHTGLSVFCFLNSFTPSKQWIQFQEIINVLKKSVFMPTISIYSHTHKWRPKGSPTRMGYSWRKLKNG